MQLIQTIVSDLERLEKPTIKAFLKWYFFPQGSTFHYDVWFRILQKCKKIKILKYTVGIIVYFVERHWSIKYGVHVNANISIGQGLRIVHGDGVYLNCKEIGKNFTCYQDVTFGENDGRHKGIPTVEDNVTVYTGAIIVGDVILHSGCVIAANAFVNFDVPENAIVGGIPAKIIGKSHKQIKGEKNERT
ncbi:MAG: hypothetical protein K6G26_08945 [Lachnospiraceae bacterium]|nr:hypothetical protein [Lachnospiraceae bacterium]